MAGSIFNYSRYKIYLTEVRTQVTTPDIVGNILDFINKNKGFSIGVGVSALLYYKDIKEKIDRDLMDCGNDKLCRVKTYTKYYTMLAGIPFFSDYLWKVANEHGIQNLINFNK